MSNDEIHDPNGDLKRVTAPAGFRAPANRAEKRAAKKAGALVPDGEARATAEIRQAKKAADLAVLKNEIGKASLTMSETAVLEGQEEGRFFIASLVPIDYDSMFKGDREVEDIDKTRETIELWLIGELDAAIDGITGGNVDDLGELVRWEPEPKTAGLPGLVMVEYSRIVKWHDDEESFEVDGTDRPAFVDPLDAIPDDDDLDGDDDDETAV